MDDFIECGRLEIIPKCPICDKGLQKDSKQPEYGTHVFTKVYKCGTEIDYPMGNSGARYGVSCDNRFKRFVMPKISKEAIERYKARKDF